MLDKEFVFVLGAQDPEMREIVAVLRKDNRAFRHAAKDGLPVAPRTAYEADGVVRLSRSGHCASDHHNPGDPGYAMPPERYMEGASIGQTLYLLELDPTPTQRLLAAADHCLTAAYQGAAYAGRPVRYRELYPGGEIKEMLKGAAPEHIERFMAGHRDQGREVYGNPYRGYAGAYIG